MRDANHHEDRREEAAGTGAEALAGSGAGTPGPRLKTRITKLLAAAFVALCLAGGLWAAAAAQPAEASEKGVCTHFVSVHYGPEGRFHKVVFVRHWTNTIGQHKHTARHYTKYHGKYFLDWTRTFWCNRTVKA